MKRYGQFLFAIALLALGLFGVRRLTVHAVGQTGANCIGDINRLTNNSGFTSGDFSSSNAIIVPSSTGAIQLDTNQVPLDPQHIVLPFAQDVDVKYVYRNAGASHMLGWFYYDQLKTGTKPFIKTVNGVDQLADWDNDGIPDWFQTKSGTSRPQDGLWHISGSNTVPDLTNSSYTYKDQTSYYFGHVPHVLELLSGVSNSSVKADHAGDFIFQLCDDDSDTSVWPSGSQGYAPVSDAVGATTTKTTNNPTGVNPDGIPDYDVNSDGTAGNEADRAVDLGTIQGNREIVFFAVTLYSSTMHRAALGLTGTGSDIAADSLPWFTKNLLNPDRNAYAANTVLRKQAIGCAVDDSVCYTAAGGNIGWLDAATIARLNTATYSYLKLDNTVNNITVGSDGSSPHFVVNAPSSDPNRWIMGFEDLPLWNADSDFNDVVFLIERNNGGLVQSNNLVQTSDVPASDTVNDYLISKIRIRFSSTYPSPGCDSVTNADIQLYWSVDNVNWYPAGFPQKSTSGDLTIDVLGQGILGHQVYWKANFISTSQYCQPKLNSINVGYEALQHGEYKFAAPIPLANVVFSGSLETGSSQWAVTRNDYRPRGHFYSSQLFDPSTLADSTTVNWDAGQVMANGAPSSRLGIFTNVAGAYTAWTSANSTTLYSKILSAADRVAKQNGSLVFDFNGDGLTNDTDAAYVMEWTRGFEYPANPPSGSSTSTARAWPLGAIHNSSPAIAGTPGHPGWLDGTNSSLGTFKTAYNGTNWLGSTSGIMKRGTVAVVGAQDGMLHGFDAGSFHNANELACASGSTRLVRGCFAPPSAGGSPDYGTGAEMWAYVPPSLINAMKNNVGPVFGNSSYPTAEVDGSVAIADIYYSPSVVVSGKPNNNFVTAAFASLGSTWKYITAVGWTGLTYNDTTPMSTLPFPLWASDWTDSDYIGGVDSPSIDVVNTPSGVKFALVTTSGLATPATQGTVDEYAYVIDASNGTTMTNGKIALDSVGTTAYGFASFPNLIDVDGDGVADRAYMIDTAGRVFRINLNLFTKCQVYSAGEPVFSGMGSLMATSNGNAKVRLYFGGGANPDGTSVPTVPAQMHVFAIEDDDPVSGLTCSTASLVYKQVSPNNGKQSTWATPYVAGSYVYLATSGSTEEGVCATGSGTLIGLGTDGVSGAPSVVTPQVNLSNSAVSSINIYDGHAFINGVSQQTAVVGPSGTWNNSNGTSNVTGNVTLGSVHWSEQ